jgi:hypothetical protein
MFDSLFRVGLRGILVRFSNVWNGLWIFIVFVRVIFVFIRVR